MIGAPPLSLASYGQAVSDYGLSRGSYDRASGPVPQIDAKLFFLLDYAKSLADYSDLGRDPANTYFVTDPDAWTPPEGYENVDWRKVTALRHFGMANVLFCDGHVEALPFEPQSDEDLASQKYLRLDSQLWRYSGM